MPSQLLTRDVGSGPKFLVILGHRHAKMNSRLGAGSVIMSASLLLALAMPLVVHADSVAPTLPAAAMAAPASEATAADEAEEEQAEQEEETKSPRRERGLVVRGYGKMGTVGLPGVGFGGGLSAGWLRNRFRLDVLGSGQLSRTNWYPGGSVGGDFSLWRAGVRACGVFGSGRIVTPICGGADGGMVTATGVGIASARTERQPWGSVFADIDLAWYVLPQVGLVTTSRWLVPLVRRQYYVGERGTLVSTPPFGVEIGFGVELVLP